MIYELESENLTKLGGRMGTESTSTNWVRYFSSIDKAKKAAEKDYKKNGGEDVIKWSKSRYGSSSQDLLFVQYSIQPIKVE